MSHFFPDNNCTWLGQRMVYKAHRKYQEINVYLFYESTDKQTSNNWLKAVACLWKLLKEKLVSTVNSTQRCNPKWQLSKRLKNSVGQGDRFVHVAPRSLCPGPNRPHTKKLVENTGNHLRSKLKISIYKFYRNSRQALPTYWRVVPNLLKQTIIPNLLAWRASNCSNS